MKFNKGLCGDKKCSWPHERSICGGKDCAALHHVDELGEACEGFTPLMSLRGRPRLAPRPVRQCNVLYLSAGLPRKADLRACFSQLITNCNASDEFEFQFRFFFTDEVDLTGGSAQNLLLAGRREHYFAKLAAEVEVLINSSPCDICSRARRSDRAGPPPVRDLQRQRGFSGLEPWAQQSVKDANTLVDFVLDATHVVAGTGVLAALEFPESLGRTIRGSPAIIWRWPRTRALAEKGMTRGSICQQDWAAIPYLKPTGLCSNAHQITSHEGVYPGWPEFDADGNYIAPLPLRESGGPGLIGKSSDGSFRRRHQQQTHQVCA